MNLEVTPRLDRETLLKKSFEVSLSRLPLVDREGGEVLVGAARHLFLLFGLRPDAYFLTY